MNPFVFGKRFYFGKSIACEMSLDDTGQRVAKCDVSLGDYTFELAAETITITVESGTLISRGVLYVKQGIRLIFQPNQLVEFSCEEAARVSVNYG